MKTKLLMTAILPALLAATPLMANTAPMAASQKVESVSQQSNGVILRTTTFSGSDAPSVSDPLGNGPVTPKHDQGPALTNRLSYDESCADEACQRAFRRWNSNTTWQQDRATGLSLGWSGSE